MFERLTDRMTARSTALLVKLDDRLLKILSWWLLVAGLLTASRIAFTPQAVTASNITAYSLLVLAPIASTLLALRWFARGDELPQPVVRSAMIGRWRSVPRAEARRHALYGAGGIMVSLLVGMMLNVPVRAAEYLAAMPPLPAEAPRWLSVMHLALTFDVVLFSSLYMVAFVAALRRVPLFPRLLLAIWMADLSMQLVIAKMVASTGDLPVPVASALHILLDGNVKKVLVSMALWLPYLILSRRVNVTFRHRIEAL